LVERLVEHLAGIPAEGVTFLLATLPIAELRGAIPWALYPTGGGLAWPVAYLWAVLGNALPVIPLLLFLGPVSEWLRRWRLFDRFFDWLFARTRRRGKVIERFEAIGLTLFVAIPLPVTGAWTGCAAAFIFGIRFRYALPAVLAGILIAGTIVTAVTLGTFEGLEALTR
jgi:uncharacterized membrane protein